MMNNPPPFRPHPPRPAPLVPSVLFVLFVLSVLSSAAAPAPSAPDTDLPARIARVESHLLPPARLAGAVSEFWTLPSRLEHYHVPGLTLAVIDHNTLAWSRGYGIARAGDLAPVTPDTLFQAGSISKTLTAAALALVESGALALDADVNTTLTSWKISPPSSLDLAAPTANQPITLRQLLSHTAGLGVQGFSGYEPGAPLPTLAQILDGLPPANSAPIRPLLPPGAKWQYSGGGYCVVQQLLLDATHQPFPEILRTRVLAPAGLTASTFEQPLSTTLAPHAAAGHTADGRRLPGDAHIYPELAAAGLWTTPTDLAHFLLALQNSTTDSATPRLFSSATAATMLTVPLAGSDYALGLGVKNSGENLQLSHTGANAGFRAIFVYYPHLGRGAIVMTNSDNGGAIVPELLRALALEYDWPDYRVIEKTAAPFAPATFDDFAGRYERNETTLVFYRKENHFYVRATNTPRVEIFPKSNHEFFQLAGDVTYSFERDEILRVTHVVRVDGSPQLFRHVDPRPDE